jgi:hypothetical protein
VKKLEIPILERARKFGYIYWFRELDSAVIDFFKDQPTISVIFNGAELGEKQIDYKNRRISLGWRWTRRLPASVSTFSINRKDANTVDVKCN